MLGGLSVFFCFFLLKDNFFPNERRRARVHEVTRLISVVTLVCSHATFFYFLVLFFEPSCWVTVFFVPFFLLVYSIVYATSLITNLGEQYSLTFVDKTKKQQKDDHVILVNENRPGTINICLNIGCVVWKPWH